MATLSRSVRAKEIHFHRRVQNGLLPAASLRRWVCATKPKKCRTGTKNHRAKRPGKQINENFKTLIPILEPKSHIISVAFLFYSPRMAGTPGYLRHLSQDPEWILARDSRHLELAAKPWCPRSRRAEPVRLYHCTDTQPTSPSFLCFGHLHCMASHLSAGLAHFPPNILSPQDPIPSQTYTDL